jgi:hypothetical protein
VRVCAQEGSKVPRNLQPGRESERDLGIWGGGRDFSRPRSGAAAAARRVPANETFVSWLCRPSKMPRLRRGDARGAERYRFQGRSRYS